MATASKGFAQFIREKKYLLNVSPATVHWYEESFKSLGDPNPSQEYLVEWVVRKREAGVSAVSVNTYSRAINCYLHWLHAGTPKCHVGCNHPHVARLKVPVRIPETFSKADIDKFMKCKPKKKAQFRLQCLILTLADCGLRIGEALNLKWEDVDFDNLLLSVIGKGDKQRKTPFSFELRRFLYKLNTHTTHRNDLVFGTRTGGEVSQNNVLRDVKLLCGQLNINIPGRTVHAFRHSFALHYLRRGGSVFHLQKVLGHSDLAMSRKYANLLTEDLSAVHQRLSMLS